MLSRYSFKCRSILVVTMMVFATLAVAITPESANAQEINTIAQIKVALSRMTFLIDTHGCGWEQNEYALQLRVLDDGVTLEGKFYLTSTAPPSDNNVHGSITVERHSPYDTGIRVSFDAAVESGSFGITIGGKHFEAAIRFPRNRDRNHRSGKVNAPLAFMAGTFITTVPDGSRTGPYPFSAIGN